MSNLETPLFHFLNRILSRKEKSTKTVYKDEDYNLLTKVDAEANDLLLTEKNTLYKNIKNLEFIHHLEMNLKDKQLNNLPMEFLTDLEQLKEHSQKNLLITLHIIKKNRIISFNT